MNPYTLLGYVTWQLGKRILKRQVGENNLKLGAAGIVTLAVVGGVIAAKSAADD